MNAEKGERCSIGIAIATAFVIVVGGGDVKLLLLVIRWISMLIFPFFSFIFCFVGSNNDSVRRINCKKREY